MPSRTFDTNFLSAFHSVTPKSKTRPLFDIDGLNAIQNSDKHYEKPKQPGKAFDGNNFEYETFLLEKFLMTRKNFTVERKMQKIRVILTNSG